MKRSTLLSASVCLVASLVVVGCGSDNINDDFNGVVLAPTSTLTATTTTGTSTSTMSTTSTTSTTSTPATAVRPALTLQRGITGVTPTDATGALVFPAATVAAQAANTTFAGSTLTFSLASGDSQGLTLTAPSTTAGTVSGSGTNSVTLTLNGTATAQQLQDFLRALRVVSANTHYGQQTPVAVTVVGAGQTTTDSGRSVRVQNTGALALTVDGSQATDATLNRYATLQEAVNAVAAAPNGQGSLITLPAGTVALPANVTIGFDTANPEAAPDSDLEGLTIAGPNAGRSAGSSPETRVAEAVLTTSGIIVNAPHVTLTGFTLTGRVTNITANFVDAQILVERKASDATISDMIVTGGASTNTVLGVLWTGRLVSGSAAASQNTDGAIVDSEFSAQNIGVYFLDDSAAGGGVASNRTDGDLVQGNYLHDISSGATALGSSHYAVTFGGGSGYRLLDNVFRNNLGFHLGLVPTTAGATATWTGNSFDGTADLQLQSLSAANNVVVNAAQNWWNGRPDPNAAAGSASDHPEIVRSSNPTTLVVDTTPVLTADPFAGR